MGAHQRRKGQRGELELAAELSRLFGVEAQRGRQYHGRDDAPDVCGLPGVHVECKRTERLQLYAALEQCQGDAGEDEIPVVFHRRNGKPWVVVVELEQLPELAVRLSCLLSKGA